MTTAKKPTARKTAAKKAATTKPLIFLVRNLDIRPYTGK